MGLCEPGAVEACEVCGFEWDAIEAGDVPVRLRVALAGWVALLESGDAALGVRPSPGIWSVMEYGAHVRDVLLNLRDRIVVGLAEDHPVPKPMYQDVRIANGVLAADTPADLVVELTVAAGLLAKTVGALDEAALARTLVYPWPRVTDRNLLWVAAQALHEAEHHLTDARAQPG